MEWYNVLVIGLIGTNVVLDVSGRHPLKRKGPFVPLFLSVVLSAPLVVQMVRSL